MAACHMLRETKTWVVDCEHVAKVTTSCIKNMFLTWWCNILSTPEMFSTQTASPSRLLSHSCRSRSLKDGQVFQRSRGVHLPVEHPSRRTGNQSDSCWHRHHLWQRLGWCWWQIYSSCFLYISHWVHVWCFCHLSRTHRQTCKLRTAVTA